MRRLLAVILVFTALICCAGDVVRLAERAYSSGEWARAQALYMLATDAPHPDAVPYGRAIVAALMNGDTTATSLMLEKALKSGIPFDSVLEVIEQSSMSLGKGGMYVGELHRIAAELPYLRRPVDARLLSYYTFRSDPDNIIRYSQALLRGMPDAPEWLNSLAYGYMLAGDNDSAAATWRRVLEVDPDNYDALLNLGNMLLATDRQAAMPLLKRACDLRPTDYLRRLTANDPRKK